MQNRVDMDETSQKEYVPTQEELDRDRWHLTLRWGGVYMGRGIADLHYGPFFLRYFQENGGRCLHDVEDWVEDIGDGWVLCLLCKRFARRKEAVEGRETLWVPLAEVKAEVKAERKRREDDTTR